jgi:amino acid transporter
LVVVAVFCVGLGVVVFGVVLLFGVVFLFGVICGFAVDSLFGACKAVGGSAGLETLRALLDRRGVVLDDEVSGALPNAGVVARVSSLLIFAFTCFRQSFETPVHFCL